MCLRKGNTRPVLRAGLENSEGAVSGARESPQTPPTPCALVWLWLLFPSPCGPLEPPDGAGGWLFPRRGAFGRCTSPRVQISPIKPNLPSAAAPPPSRPPLRSPPPLTAPAHPAEAATAGAGREPGASSNQRPRARPPRPLIGRAAAAPRINAGRPGRTSRQRRGAARERRRRRRAVSGARARSRPHGNAVGPGPPLR